MLDFLGLIFCVFLAVRLGLYGSYAPLLDLLVVMLVGWNSIVASEITPIDSKFNDLHLLIISFVSVTLFKLFQKLTDIPCRHTSVSLKDVESSGIYCKDSPVLTNIPGDAPPNSHLKNLLFILGKLFITYMTFTSAFVILTPNSWLLSSSKVIFEQMSTTVKTEHFIYTFEAEFLIFTVITFCNAISQPGPGRRFNLIAIRFIWLYSSFTLLGCIHCLLIFNDTLAILHSQNIYNLENVNFLTILLTQIILGNLNCANNDATSCTEMDAKFTLVQDIMTQNWVIVYAAIFIVAPIIVWILQEKERDSTKRKEMRWKVPQEI